MNFRVHRLPILEGAQEYARHSHPSLNMSLYLPRNTRASSSREPRPKLSPVYGKPRSAGPLRSRKHAIKFASQYWVSWYLDMNSRCAWCSLHQIIASAIPLPHTSSRKAIQPSHLKDGSSHLVTVSILQYSIGINILECDNSRSFVCGSHRELELLIGASLIRGEAGHKTFFFEEKPHIREGLSCYIGDRLSELLVEAMKNDARDDEKEIERSRN